MFAISTTAEIINQTNKQSMYCLHINRICTNNEYYLVIDLIRNIHLHRDTVINSNDQSKRNREKKDMKTKTKYNRTPAVYSETYYVDDIVFPSQICNKTNADYSFFFSKKNNC